MDTTPKITRCGGQEIRLEWPGLVVLAFDRGGEMEVGQFASEDVVTRAEVEARVRTALVTGSESPDRAPSPRDG
mgnify:FL=1